MVSGGAVKSGTIIRQCNIKKNYRYVKGKKLLKNIIEKPPGRSHPQIEETISS